MKFLSFTLNKNKYTINTDFVKEIIENNVEIKDVPNSAEYVAGISNIRGEVVEIINLSNYLNTKPSEENVHIIIANQDDIKKGILVDSVEQILDEFKLISTDLSVVNDSTDFDGAYVNRESKDIYLNLDMDNFFKKENLCTV